MSKRRSKKQNKIIASIIGAIILMVLAFLGVNTGTIEEVAKAIGMNELTGNEVVKETSENTKTEEVNATTEVSGDLIVDYIDVGQADSILIRNNNYAMLIDAGNNEDGKDVLNFIKEKGITKLDYVIGTHPHEDHIGGLDDIINSDLEIENILMPKISTNTKTFEDVLDAISNKGLTVTAPKKDDIFEIGKAKCTVMTDSILDQDNLNLSSIIIRLEYGENSFLFMGDAEEENEKQINWPKTDVLKVGHHGSNTSSSERFINEVQPKYSIIMVGKDNSYKLPKQETIDKLNNIGSEIYRTDENGTIEIISNGENIEVTVAK